MTYLICHQIIYVLCASGTRKTHVWHLDGSWLHCKNFISSSLHTWTKWKWSKRVQALLPQRYQGRHLMRNSCEDMRIQGHPEQGTHGMELNWMKYANTVSFIRIEKSPFSWWRRNSKANTPSGSHRKNPTREDKNKQKTHASMNKSASLTSVQGPLTVVCMIVT